MKRVLKDGTESLKAKGSLGTPRDQGLSQKVVKPLGDKQTISFTETMKRTLAGVELSELSEDSRSSSPTHHLRSEKSDFTIRNIPAPSALEAERAVNSQSNNTPGVTLRGTFDSGSHVLAIGPISSASNRISPRFHQPREDTISFGASSVSLPENEQGSLDANRVSHFARGQDRNNTEVVEQTTPPRPVSSSSIHGVNRRGVNLHPSSISNTENGTSNIMTPHLNTETLPEDPPRILHKSSVGLFIEELSRWLLSLTLSSSLMLILSLLEISRQKSVLFGALLYLSIKTLFLSVRFWRSAKIRKRSKINKIIFNTYLSSSVGNLALIFFVVT